MEEIYRPIHVSVLLWNVVELNVGKNSRLPIQFSLLNAFATNHLVKVAFVRAFVCGSSRNCVRSTNTYKRRPNNLTIIPFSLPAIHPTHPNASSIYIRIPCRTLAVRLTHLTFSSSSQKRESVFTHSTHNFGCWALLFCHFSTFLTTRMAVKIPLITYT